MRRRIAARLELQSELDPANSRLANQLALLDTAWINTLHGFCLRLVREHFHRLGLDPEFTVLDQAQRALLAAQSLDAVLARRFAGSASRDRAIQDLVLSGFIPDEQALRELVLRLHTFLQTLPEPSAWIAAQQAAFSDPAPSLWRVWFTREFRTWQRAWRRALAEATPAPSPIQECQDILEQLDTPAGADDARRLLDRLASMDASGGRRSGPALPVHLEPLALEARFLADCLPPAPDVKTGTEGAGPAAAPVADPLAQDWAWVRRPMTALIDLEQDFAAAFAAAKRDLAALDFQDLEQYALQLLWDRDRQGPSPLAELLRARLRYVFVDEYQDINAVQDRLVTAVARGGNAGNRFLVGDVKQSIYRFRLANPGIFQDYATHWSAPAAEGRLIALTHNFRSHPAILDFANRIFSALMQRDVGGVQFDAQAWLQPGRPVPPASLPAPAPNPIEMHLLAFENRRSQAVPPDPPAAAAGQADPHIEREAWVLAQRLLALRDEQFPIRDRDERRQRPADWRDMVILLRSPRDKVDAFARAFDRAGIPLLAVRRGLYSSLEVSDLLALLQLLDNPLQDLPLLAVLRSPLVGLTPAELAAIRLALPAERFWTALETFHRAAPNPNLATTAAKIDRFVDRWQRWRSTARQCALSRTLETILDETQYECLIEASPRGPQRRANVQRLLALTRQFDRFEHQSLFRFLKYVEAQQAVDFDPEPALLESGNAVRLMSIHQSKGLEFPIVALPDLAKPFNLDDARGPVLLDPELGLCPTVTAPGMNQSYPSFLHWLASRRVLRETLGEEIRLLYVALTRARDKLILIASADPKRLDQFRNSPATPPFTAAHILAARNALDWLGPLIPDLTGHADSDGPDRADSTPPPVTLCVHRNLDPSPTPAPPTTAPGVSEAPNTRLSGRVADSSMDRTSLDAIGRRLAWSYHGLAATRQAAKVSVTGLQRHSAASAEPGLMLVPNAPSPTSSAPNPAPRPGSAIDQTAVDCGTANHRFLQLAEPARLTTLPEAEAEARGLLQNGRIAAREAAALDLPAIVDFWRSDLGAECLARRVSLHRELEFTLRLAPADLAALALPVAPGLAPDEFVVLQGVVDLAVIAPEEIWIVDFKTDRIRAAEVADRTARHAPQLGLYALALERIYRRPVTRAWLHFLALSQRQPVSLDRIAALRR